MLRKNVKSLLEQLQVCIFAEIVFGVRCTLKKQNNKLVVSTSLSNVINVDKNGNGLDMLLFCVGRLLPP